jgi:hypothetical protein
MDLTFQTGIPAAPADHTGPDATECLLAPPVFTDGAGRALVIYQRLIESGFDTAQVLTGA